MSNQRIIRVTGKGLIKVHPDQTRITMTLEGVYPEYAETLRHSSRDTEQLKDLLAPFGFARSDLKTLDFRVDPSFERYKEEGIFKQRLVGYEFRHEMKVEFASDPDQLGNVLYALANSPIRPEFRISYTVKDPEAVKNALLGKAVTDAREKAAALTQAAGTMLKDIQMIDYSWGEMELEVRPMNRSMALETCAPMPTKQCCYEMDMEPDDIEVSDTVTVVWEIA